MEENNENHEAIDQMAVVKAENPTEIIVKNENPTDTENDDAKNK